MESFREEKSNAFMQYNHQQYNNPAGGALKRNKSGATFTGNSSPDVASRLFQSSLFMREESLRAMQLLRLQQALEGPQFDERLFNDGGRLVTPMRLPPFVLACPTRVGVDEARFTPYKAPNVKVPSSSDGLYFDLLQRQNSCLNQSTGQGDCSHLQIIHPAGAPQAPRSRLPALLSNPSYAEILSQFQVYLRSHIQVFCATSTDVALHVRGRNKRIQVGQVGLRCRHCAPALSVQRTKGAVYFPASTLGVYQAAQNMSTTHLQCGACPYMSESIKSVFTKLMVTKTSTNTSGGGRAYWSHCARQMGLVDTDQGVFLVETIPREAQVMDPKDQCLYQTKVMKRPYSLISCQAVQKP